MLRRAALALAFAAIACTPRAPSPELRSAAATALWRAALARLDVPPDGLDDLVLVACDGDEPGLRTDGVLQIPTAWLEDPRAPSVLARVAHLGLHRARGVPLLEPTPEPASCQRWLERMAVEERLGLEREALVLTRLGAAPARDWLERALADRLDAYRQRCLRARSTPPTSPADRQVP